MRTSAIICKGGGKQWMGSNKMQRTVPYWVLHIECEWNKVLLTTAAHLEEERYIKGLWMRMLPPLSGTVVRKSRPSLGVFSFLLHRNHITSFLHCSGLRIHSSCATSADKVSEIGVTYTGCLFSRSGDLQQVLLHPHGFLLLLQDLVLNEPEEILHSAPWVGLHGGVETRQGFQLFLLSAAHLQEILFWVHLQRQPPAKCSGPLVTVLK